MILATGFGWSQFDVWLTGYSGPQMMAIIVSVLYVESKAISATPQRDGVPTSHIGKTAQQWRAAALQSSAEIYHPSSDGVMKTIQIDLDGDHLAY
jgi:hypothetical protein